MTIFDILRSISETKISVVDHEDFEKTYKPFMINRYLIASVDTLFLANIMNSMEHLPKKVQYEFYFNGIEKKKRYFQYIKEDKSSEHIENIIRCYNCNHNTALEYIELLNEEQLDKINKLYTPRIER